MIMKKNGGKKKKEDGEKKKEDGGKKKKEDGEKKKEDGGKKKEDGKKKRRKKEGSEKKKDAGEKRKKDAGEKRKKKDAGKKKRIDIGNNLRFYEERHEVSQQTHSAKTRLSLGRIIHDSAGTGYTGQIQPVLPVKKDYLNCSFLRHTENLLCIIINWIVLSKITELWLKLYL